VIDYDASAGSAMPAVHVIVIVIVIAARVTAFGVAATPVTTL
jgi:hypothetical protein